jgi:3-oxoacyl-[acyl-carrier-protein] synthase-1
MEEMGLRCCVYGPVKPWDKSLSKQARQTASTVAQYGVTAAIDAIEDAGLTPGQLCNDRTGVVVGTAFGGISEVFRTEQLVLKQKKPSRAGITGIVKIMNSTVSGNLATYFGINGITCSLSSSFASGADNIGYGYELIKYGLQDVCICGAAEGDCWKQLAAYYDNWGGMPRDCNQRPTEACRPYDRDRQGFVMSAGAGIIVLEELEHARKRGSKIYGEIAGYGTCNDGDDMIRPSGTGLRRSIQQALKSASKYDIHKIDYINTHGTGTPLGDKVEVEAINESFEKAAPLISSTKGLTGHGMGATGAQEAVYTLLMLKHNFIAPTINLKNIAQECTGVPHVQEVIECELKVVMTTNVGLGGAAACIIITKSDTFSPNH